MPKWRKHRPKEYRRPAASSSSARGESAERVRGSSALKLSTIVSLVAALIVIVAMRRASLRINSEPLKSQEPFRARSSTPSVSFVGAHTCGGCHEQELNRWKGSHHQIAMQPANGSTVLGNFKDASFTCNGITSRFFRRDGKFMVRTDGPDGALHDYEIKFTFGVSPLQQYLIAFPGGRLQALGIAWDSRPSERGGQRWFHLYPGQTITSHDSMHWTGLDQNWNFMCADCHSTNLRKNYDSRTRTFATSYAEVDVACEACHGPGSSHVEWAKKQGNWKRLDPNKGLLIALKERQGIGWSIDAATGNAKRSSPRQSELEIQMCARCHARRSQIHEDYVHGQPVGDDYRVSLLEDNLYFPDGQIKDEVYEYGSFIQSKMFHAGVTCSDCHDPHSLGLRADSNNVCLQCHSEDKYHSPKHHFHMVGSAGARCVECHMPTRTYMIIDARRDHSIRIPRPDLSSKLGTPNACNRCHTDKSSEWASEFVSKWYKHTPIGFQTFGETLNAGRIGAPGAERSLTALIAGREQPAIARASALVLLAPYVEGPGRPAIRDGVADDSPLVRRSAARAMSDADPRASAKILAPLLSDPVRAVRLEAAEVLAGATPGALSADVAAALEHSTEEYIAAQDLNSDRPEALLDLALLFVKQKQFPKAEAQLTNALSLDPSFAPAAVNLADLDRELGRDADGERVLHTAIAQSPDNASLEHVLGLQQARQGHVQEALSHLATAARLDPDNARFGYVYAVALNDAGKADASIGVLEGVIRKHPYDRDSLAMLVNIYQNLGNVRQALAYADRLAELAPGDPDLARLLTQLRSEARQ